MEVEAFGKEWRGRDCSWCGIEIGEEAALEWKVSVVNWEWKPEEGDAGTTWWLVEDDKRNGWEFTVDEWKITEEVEKWRERRLREEEMMGAEEG